MSDTFIDVAIIGAGAAGIAAAVALQPHAINVCVLEARARIGGRAHTIHINGNLPLDLGAGWLHSADRNPLSPLAAQHHFTIDKTPPPWNRRSLLQDDMKGYSEALNTLDERLAVAAKTGVDRPASDLLETGCPWNPLLDAFSTFYNGDPFALISVLDYAAYEDTEVNWRLKEGYGSLIAALGRDLPVMLGTPVAAVDFTGRMIAVETSRGTLHAKAVIVAVPTSILAEERICFRPGLPDKLAAAAGLPLGLANKLFLGLRTPDILPVGERLFGHPDRTETCAYHLRPFGQPYIEAYCGGPHAHELEKAGPDGFAAFAIDELAGILGSDIRKELSHLASSAWKMDPYALGSYSHALPGHAGDRKRLAENIEGRVFFAGEACSPSHFSTIHGAYESGIAAAKDVLATLSVIPTA